MGLYETLHFTAKASVRKTTQGTSQVWSKLWGPRWGYHAQGWWQIQDPLAAMAPDTAQGGCPLPQRHRKLTPEEHVDQRKDEEGCQAVPWQRRWSSTSGA